MPVANEELERPQTSSPAIRSVLVASGVLIGAALLLTVIALNLELVPGGTTTFEGVAATGWSVQNVSFVGWERVRANLTVGSCYVEAYLVTAFEYRAFTVARGQLENDVAYRRLPRGEQVRILLETVQARVDGGFLAPLDCTRVGRTFPAQVSMLLVANSAPLAEPYVVDVTLLTRPPAFLPMLVVGTVSGAGGVWLIVQFLRAKRRRARGDPRVQPRS